MPVDGPSAACRDRSGRLARVTLADGSFRIDRSSHTHTLGRPSGLHWRTDLLPRRSQRSGLDLRGAAAASPLRHDGLPGARGRPGSADGRRGGLRAQSGGHLRREAGRVRRGHDGRHRAIGHARCLDRRRRPCRNRACRAAQRRGSRRDHPADLHEAPSASPGAHLPRDHHSLGFSRFARPDRSSSQSAKRRSGESARRSHSRLNQRRKSRLKGHTRMQIAQSDASFAQ